MLAPDSPRGFQVLHAPWDMTVPAGVKTMRCRWLWGASGGDTGHPGV